MLSECLSFCDCDLYNFWEEGLVILRDYLNSSKIKIPYRGGFRCCNISFWGRERVSKILQGTISRFPPNHWFNDQEIFWTLQDNIYQTIIFSMHLLEYLCEAYLKPTPRSAFYCLTLISLC